MMIFKRFLIPLDPVNPKGPRWCGVWHQQRAQQPQQWRVGCPLSGGETGPFTVCWAAADLPAQWQSFSSRWICVFTLNLKICDAERSWAQFTVRVLSAVFLDTSASWCDITSRYVQQLHLEQMNLEFACCPCVCGASSHRPETKRLVGVNGPSAVQEVVKPNSSYCS